VARIDEGRFVMHHLHPFSSGHGINNQLFKHRSERMGLIFYSRNVL